MYRIKNLYPELDPGVLRLTGLSLLLLPEIASNNILVSHEIH